MSRQLPFPFVFRNWLTGCSWDKEACKYRIGEPVETRSSLDDYAEYAFVARERVGTQYFYLAGRNSANRMIRTKLQGGHGIHRHQIGRPARHPACSTARHQSY
jgi:hypothetical protein